MPGSRTRLLAVLATCALTAQAWADSAQKKPLTNDARALYEWVARSKDHGGRPFMIIDKRQAHLWVFDPSARLQGDAPVLLGSARGDHTLPGIGQMPLSKIQPGDRTTPAGRFEAEVGRNLRGESVVWVDYDAAVSMHPVLTSDPSQRRAERLATPTPADNRVSFGCINVPTKFHETVVLGTVKSGPSVVYVLPETQPLRAVFTRLAGEAASAAGRSSTVR